MNTIITGNLATIPTPVHEPPPRAANDATPTSDFLEHNVPLSQSVLWQLQIDYYTKRGVDAWASGAIPHYITTNPLIAGAYAEIVAAYVADVGATPVRPLTVLELGAGHGRFAFLFLKRLDEIGDYTPELAGSVRYIMSDCVVGNLEAARKHPLFESYISAGRLAFARFDARNDERPVLLAEEFLETEDDLNNGPLCVIANYVLDSLAADAFRVHHGRLKESLLAIRSPEKDPTAPGYLEQLQLIYGERDTEAAGYYDEGVYNNILAEYAESLGDTQFLLPIDAMRCLERLRNLSDGRFLLVSADKGVSRKIGLQAGYGGPGMSIHGGGCFSVMVNYHAIGRQFELVGGQAHHPERSHENLNISCFTTEAAPAAVHAYRRFVRNFGPDDFFSLSLIVEQHYDSLSVAQMLAYLRLSSWDAKLLGDLMPALGKAAASAPESVQNEVLAAVTRCRELYFPLRGEAQDINFLAGGLLFDLGFYAEAVPCFEDSLKYSGPAAETYHNLGICHKARRDLTAADYCFAQALAIDSDFDAARRQRIAIQAFYELNPRDKPSAPYKHTREKS